MAIDVVQHPFVDDPETTPPTIKCRRASCNTTITSRAYHSTGYSKYVKHVKQQLGTPNNPPWFAMLPPVDVVVHHLLQDMRASDPNLYANACS